MPVLLLPPLLLPSTKASLPAPSSRLSSAGQAPASNASREGSERQEEPCAQRR